MENSSYVLNTKRATAFDLIHTYTSTSGLKLYLCPMPNVKMATCYTDVMTGSIHENCFLGCGLSHFLEHMMFHGSRQFPGRTEIADRVSACGGYLNACTSWDATQYFMTIPPDFASTALAMQVDMMRAPLFPEEEFKREREVILRECDMYAGRPDNIIWEALQNELFTGLPLRLPVIGVSHKLKAVTREMMMDYFRKRYTPERIFFVVAGSFRETEIIAEFEKQTSGWLTEDYSNEILDSDILISFGRREIELSHPDPLARMMYVWSAPGKPDRMCFAMPAMSDLMNNLMNPMIRKLQYDKPTALGLDTSYMYEADAHHISVSAQMRPEHIEETEQGIFEEIERLRSGCVTEIELERMHSDMKFERMMLLLDSFSFARRVASNIAQVGNTDFATVFRMEDAVNQEDITDAARMCFRDNCFIRVLMTPPDAKKQTEKMPVALTEAEPKVYNLDCGAKLMHAEDASLPLTDVLLFLPGGAICEDRPEAGISALIAHSIKSGCRRYSEEEIQAILSKNAITLVCDAGRHSIAFGFLCTKDKFPIALDLFCAILEEPLFEDSKIDRDRSKCFDALESLMQSQPEFLVAEKIKGLLFTTEHPYGRNFEDTLKALKTLRSENLRRFYRERMMNKEQAVLSLGGDLSKEEAIVVADKIFSVGPWHQTPVTIPEPPPMPESQTLNECHSAARQTSIAVAFRMPGMGQGNDLLFNLLMSIENGMSSTLFKTIRGKHGFAYATFMKGRIGYGCSYAEMIALTSKKNADACLKLLRAEFERLRTGGIQEEEFRNAVSAQKISFDSANVLDSIKRSALDLFLGLGARRSIDDRERLNTLTLEEFNAWLRKSLADVNTVAFTQMPEKDKEEESPEAENEEDED